MAQRRSRTGRPSVVERKVHLPVITAVRVDGYLLYPGEHSSYTLEHSFPPGVSVIVGVNGQGKTTFLNMLYRALVGPWEQTKADFVQPGKRQHNLTEIKKFDYFTTRLGESETAASVEVTVEIGKETLRIQRSLGTSLSIEALWHGENEIAEPDDEKWLDLVKEFSGLSGRYDFHFVVRHFLFFLEDKIPLLWNPYGQFEILRILFLNSALSDQCVELHDQILREDSIYRNLLWQNNQRVDRLREMKMELFGDADGEQKDAIEELAVLRERLTAAELRAENSINGVSSALQAIEVAEARLFGKQIELSNSQLQLEAVEREFFKSAFPDADKVSELVFGYLLAGDQCLVCGTDQHDAAARIRKLLRNRRCPACDSELRGRKKIAGPTVLAASRLKKNEAACAELEQEIEALEADIENQRRRLSESMAERAEAQKLLSGLRMRVHRSANLSGLPAEFSALEQEAEEIKGELREKSELLKSLRSQYDRRLAQANEQIEVIAQAILDKFKEYADKFVLEKTVLKYELHERILGQSGQTLRFPNFVLWLASAASADTSERDDVDEVSESQREFIDLAFRMALLDVAVSKHGPAMIVIETPEASLDTVFVARAGQMLRAFSKASPRNRVIATSNVNGESMIGWLLGTIGSDKKKTTMKSLKPRMLNLLVEGRATRAYQKEKSTYNSALMKAIYGE